MRQSVHWERALGTAFTSVGNGLHEQNLVKMKSFIWLRATRRTWRHETSLFWRWPLDTICYTGTYCCTNHTLGLALTTGESPWPNNAMQHMRCTSITLNWLNNRSRSFWPLNRSQTRRIHASTGECLCPSYTMQQMHENPQQHPHRSHSKMRDSCIHGWSTIINLQHVSHAETFPKTCRKAEMTNPRTHMRGKHNHDSTMHNTTNTSINQLVNQRYHNGYMILHMYNTLEEIFHGWTPVKFQHHANVAQGNL